MFLFSYYMDVEWEFRLWVVCERRRVSSIPLRSVYNVVHAYVSFIENGHPTLCTKLFPLLRVLYDVLTYDLFC